MQQLKAGSFLQGGRYRIEKVLGQGGFGITYLATQELLDRKVCIKEFFLKEYCVRDEATSRVSLGTLNTYELVGRFMTKFLKEARTISQLEHPHIIHIHDIFKENNTAYYVMEYIEGDSLADRVKRYGALSESEAIEYIKQVASALEFIHQRSINHLDVKPANIMIRKADNKAVLIDFGLSKQYDASGEQTSTTPVGISHGYAPMEQYNVGGVGTFSPQTDIYSLGATLYKLLTGKTPPQAIEIFNDGLPQLPNRISSSIVEAMKKAMQPKKAERYNNIGEFLREINQKKVVDKVSNLHDKEETVVIPRADEAKQSKKISAKKKTKFAYYIIFLCVIALFAGLFRAMDVKDKEEVALLAERIEQQRIYDSIAVVRREEVEKRRKDSIAQIRLLDELRKKDSIAVTRREEAEKRRKDSIDALNEQARLATIRKLEEERRRKEEMQKKEQVNIRDIKFVAEAPREVKVGERFYLTYTINTNDIKDFRTYQIYSFDIIGGPEISSFGKGKKFTYILKATKDGDFNIPSASGMINGEMVNSNALRIKVYKDVWIYGQYELDKKKLLGYLQSNAESFMDYYSFNDEDRKLFINALKYISQGINNGSITGDGYGTLWDGSVKLPNEHDDATIKYVNTVAKQMCEKYGTLRK